MSRIATSDDTSHEDSSWRARIRERLGLGLDEATRADFDADVAATNRRRMKALLPVFMVGHVVHIAVFWPSPAARSELDPVMLRWKEGIALVHLATLAVALLFAALAFAPTRGRVERLLGPAAALTYLVYGAVIAGVDQLSVTSVTPFIGYCVGVAVVTVLAPRVTLLIYPLALAIFVAGILTVQESSRLRLATLPNGITSVVLSIALSILLYGARRRDFVQRVTIERQRKELAELNAGLERRVADQVSEIVEHSQAVARLNAQLRAQVQARSTELSLALAKLARHGDLHGTLERGAVLGNRFEILGLLGQGGMGFVYCGVDRSTGSRVAVKVIQASSAKELDALQRFVREVKNAATITHPGVVQMLHVDISDDGMLYQVQELVEGQTLEQVLQTRKRWPAGHAARCVGVLCDALAAAHAQGIVHRDVKPANIMLTGSPPGLRLLDFGVSRLYEGARGSEGVTMTGAVVGTPAYMSPEQAMGVEITDRVDVYSAGVILFSLLTGKHPFSGETPRALLLKQLVAEPPDARSFEPGVPAELAELAARCLKKAAAERPAASELADALGRMADDLMTPPLHDCGIVVESRSSADLAMNAAETTALDRRRHYA